MKKIVFLLTNMCLLMFQMAYSQSIRKDYYEMTTVEREEYVRVMNKLYSDGVVSDFVSTHANSNFVRHAHPEFLPWHRIMLYYFERQAKVENKYLNLGYMNWFPTNGIALRSDNLLFSNGRTPAGTIFDPLAAGWIGLLGYSSNWNFTRFNNSSNTVSIANVFGDLQSIVNENTFENVRRVIETGNHNDQHVWIGGSFGTMAFVAISPRDPTFYFHHSMTDYAWQRWLAEKWIFGDYGNIISTSQPSVNNQPLYNPQSIFDNRTVKLWYATEGTVKLKNYTVTNQTLGVSTGPEFYFYTGKIEVATTMGEYFTVPSGQEANMESMTEIALLPGFSAVPGSKFGAEVINTFPTGSGGGARLERTPEEIKIENSVDSLLTVSPNPSKGEFNIKSHKPYTVLGLFNLSGQMVDIKQEIDNIILVDPRVGMYILVVITDKGRRYSKKLIVE